MSTQVPVNNQDDQLLRAIINRGVTALNMPRRWDAERVAKRAFDSAKIQLPMIARWQKFIDVFSMLSWIILMTISITRPAGINNFWMLLFGSCLILVVKGVAKGHIYRSVVSEIIFQTYTDYIGSNNVPS